MNSKKLLCIGVTGVLVLAVLAMFTAGASAEGGYTYITKWGSLFSWPAGIAVDSNGYVYVADTLNNRIQKFDSDGTFITKWGSEGIGDGEFYSSYGIAVDSSGYVYVTDLGNHRIQKFDSNGNFITKWGSEGIGDGEFYYSYGIAVDSSSYVYVTDYTDTWTDRIQKFDSDGTFITKWGSWGFGDGEFNCPRGIAVDSSGCVYVADTFNNRIQKFDSDGNFITKWGSVGLGDGELDWPAGIAVDSSGNVYVADSRNHRIQKFDSDGNFITKWGSSGTGDGQFNLPEDIAVDSSGYVYVVDTGNDRIQKFAPGVPEEPLLAFTPSSHDFGDKCEGDTDSTTFAIWNSRTGTLTYSLSESCGWVEVNPTSGCSIGEHDTITVDIDTTGLSEGSHTCDISISSNGGSGTFTVTVNVVSCPELSYSPASYDFGDKCEGVTDSTTFMIWNSGTGTLTYSLSESCSWVGVNPTSGSSTGEHDTLTVDIDTTGLSEGPHTCDISISSNDGSGTFTVTVNIIGELQTSITTDKYEYHPGDTMTMTVALENPTASSVDTYFVLLFILPEYSYYQPMLVTRLTLPPYFDQTYNKDIYVGNWATSGVNAEWYVALLETSAPYDILCDDTAEWRYDPLFCGDKGTSKGGSAPAEEVVPEKIAEAIMKSIGEIALPVELVQEEEITEEILDAILD